MAPFIGARLYAFEIENQLLRDTIIDSINFWKASKGEPSVEHSPDSLSFLLVIRKVVLKTVNLSPPLRLSHL